MLVVTLAKRIFPIATVLVLLGLAVFLLPPRQPLVPSVQGTSRTISLVGTITAWNASTNRNPTITVTQGDTVTIALTSTDTTHQFYVDVNRNGAPDCPSPPTSSPDKCSVFFTPASPTTFTFSVDFPAGTYNYYCSVHPFSMLGKFVVQATPTPDFSIMSNPSSLTFLQGSSGTSTITLTSLNGFSGTVNLAATASPVGPTPSLIQTSVTISAGTPGTSTLTVSTTSSTLSGTYTVKINGTSGSTTHSTVVTVQVNAPASQDFSISSNPASLNVTQGSSSSSTIMLTSVNGFSGILSLTETISPSGPGISLSPMSVSLSAGGSVASTMTVSATAGAYGSVATGIYSLNVTVTNGSLSHSKVIPVTVSSSTSTPPPSGSGGLPVVALVGAAIAIIAAVGVIVYLVRRKTVTS